MSERTNMSKVAKYFNAVDGCTFRVMPDTGGKTHKKPYDAFLIYEGRHFSIEGKDGNDTLKKHQHEALQEDIDAGGKGFVFRFTSTGVSIIKYAGADEDTWKDIRFKDLATIDGALDTLFWMVRA